MATNATNKQKCYFSVGKIHFRDAIVQIMRWKIVSNTIHNYNLINAVQFLSFNDKKNVELKLNQKYMCNFSHFIILNTIYESFVKNKCFIFD